MKSARRPARSSAGAALALAALVCAACRPASNQPTVTGAWSPAPPPGADVAAVYMSVVSGSADTLVGAQSGIAADVQMHSSSEEGGVMKMRPLQAVELSPGKTFRFQPGGAHFMLVGLHVRPTAGSRFPLQLHFRNAGDVTVEVTVTGPGASPPAD
jgi:periplasmic copper chaperone A